MNHFVTTAFLNLRKRPVKQQGNVLLVLPPDTVVDKVGQDSEPGWLNVRTVVGSTWVEGFVSEAYLRPTERELLAPATADRIVEVHYRPGNQAITRNGTGRVYPLNESGLVKSDLRKLTDLGVRCEQIHEVINFLDVEHSLRYAPNSSRTYCNIYAYDVAYCLGAFLPRVWWTDDAVLKLRQGITVQPLYDQTVRELTANLITDWFDQFGVSFGWKRVFDLHQLQQEVNRGMLGVIVAQRINLNNPGHIDVVVPERQDLQAKRSGAAIISPLQSQAGAKNKKYYTGFNWWEDTTRFKKFAFWLWPGSAAGPELPGTPPVTVQLLEKAIQRHSTEWSELYDGPFESIGIARKISGGVTGPFCIQFDVREKKALLELRARIPEFIAYSDDGITYLLPTDVVEVGETTLTGYAPVDVANRLTGHRINPRQPGVGCGRQATSSTGTIGMLVRQRSQPGKIYLLSCYHVLCSPELARGIFRLDERPENPGIISPSTADDDAANPQLHLIGEVEKGLLDEGDASHRAVDAAIAELKGNPVAPELYNSAEVPRSGLYIDPFHAQEGYPVRMYGRSSAYQEGIVVSHYTDKPINYPSNANPVYRRHMRGVIKVSKISIPGDSGALVFDEQYRAVGLAFASNSVYTYVIPYHTIFSRLNLDFL